jgi:glycogen debranching enzyme
MIYRRVRSRGALSTAFAWFVLFLTSAVPAWCQPSVRSVTANTLQLSRPLRSWEFLPITGERAALLGDEQGRMEAWVYPLKLLRNFHVVFHIEGQTIPAEFLARSLQVYPESATIRYSGDNFNIQETFFVPVQESGALVLFDVQTEQSLEIEIDFLDDFQLEWPGSLGDAYEELATDGRSFQFGEESHRFAGLIGSPTAVDAHSGYETNYYQHQESSFRLGVTSKGSDTKIVAIAASTQGLEDATTTFHKLITSWPDLLKQSSAYYRDYLDGTVALDLPDAQLQQAYDWARISVIQGLVHNPQLGTGLIAGYRTSGTGQRPGFAWFFGRDALWTSFALDAEGDTDTTRTALAFISKFQRDDGKIPHEISQAAGYIDWFKNFPYAYASADATPLYIIAMNDYLLHSGDTAFVKEQWPSIWKAYQFLRSTWDAQGFPRNEGVG